MFLFKTIEINLMLLDQDTFTLQILLVKSVEH